MENNNNCSTTSGLSYPYKIRQSEFTGTNTTNSSSYHNLKGYDSSKKRKIISPTPTTEVASIFYNFKPHDYKIPPVSYDNLITSKDNKYFITKNSQDISPYIKISQGDYVWGGWDNLPFY